MKVHPVGLWGSLLAQNIRYRLFSAKRDYLGTSVSLLVLRLRYRNMHLSNHFPYAKVGPTFGSGDRHAEPPCVCATPIEVQDLSQQAPPLVRHLDPESELDVLA